MTKTSHFLLAFLVGASSFAIPAYSFAQATEDLTAKLPAAKGKEKVTITYNYRDAEASGIATLDTSTSLSYSNKLNSQETIFIFAGIHDSELNVRTAQTSSRGSNAGIGYTRKIGEGLFGTVAAFAGKGSSYTPDPLFADFGFTSNGYGVSAGLTQAVPINTKLFALGSATLSAYHNSEKSIITNNDDDDITYRVTPQASLNYIFSPKWGGQAMVKFDQASGPITLNDNHYMWSAGLGLQRKFEQGFAIGGEYISEVSDEHKGDRFRLKISKSF